MAEQNDLKFTRRELMKQAGYGFALASGIGSIIQPAKSQSSAGQSTKSDREQMAAAPDPMPPDERLGYAIVGLGKLSLEELMPAFAKCKKSKPVALVSGNAAKARQVAHQYGLNPKNIYDYKNFDSIRNNPEVKIVYIVLPNNMHEEYTIRALRAGKHVLCEKPMANSVKECQRMIGEAEKAKLKLMIAYRCQYEPYNRQIIEMSEKQIYGPLKLIVADNNAQRDGDPNQWRLKKAMSGGGPLPDIGIYCLNAARYITKAEPFEVFATAYSTPGDPRFKEVEESMSFTLKFPGEIIANCTTSYNSYTVQRYQVFATEGSYGLWPAFPYHGLRMNVHHSVNGVEHVDDIRLPEKNHFALEMDHFSDCVINDRRPHTPGEEGLQDMRIIEAIYESVKIGKPVKIPALNIDFRGPAPSE